MERLNIQISDILLSSSKNNAEERKPIHTAR